MFQALICENAIFNVGVISSLVWSGIMLSSSHEKPDKEGMILYLLFCPVRLVFFLAEFMFIVLQCPFKGHLNENLMSWLQQVLKPPIQTGINLHYVKNQMFLFHYRWDTSFFLKKISEFTDC